jgi:hypothetical protein
VTLAAAFYVYIYRKWDYKKKFVFKTVLVYLSLACTIIWISALITTIVDVVEQEQDRMLESRLERAEGTAWRGDYGWMADHMDMDQDYEPEFEHLWERLYMYNGSKRYIIFRAASEAGLGEAYEQRAAEWEERLLKVCTCPEYEENIPYGKAFLEQAEIVQ